jgi:tetratricopeptide (TPR) repeat protein
MFAFPNGVFSGILCLQIENLLEVSGVRKTLESMLRAGQAELVLQEADRYFKGAGKKHPDDQWIAVRAVQAAGQLRSWGLSVAWADRCWRTAPVEPEIVGLLHFYKGTALIYIGDIYRAEAELQQFRAVAVEVPKLQALAGDVLFNLAYVKRLLGEPQRETQLFAEAAQAYEAAGRSGQVAGCQYEISWSLLLAGSPDDAALYLQAAVAALLQSDEPTLPAKLALATALLQALRGSLLRANRICERVVRRYAILPEQIADAHWILGCNALKAGDRARAASHAADAYDAAIQHWWPPQLDRINALKAQIERVGMVGR